VVRGKRLTAARLNALTFGHSTSKLMEKAKPPTNKKRKGNISSNMNNLREWYGILDIYIGGKESEIILWNIET